MKHVVMLYPNSVPAKKGFFFILRDWVSFAPIQLISFWFHKICMCYQQSLGGELWFPGDVARYGGGIQIMHCSKLAPCVSSLLCCSKTQRYSPEVSDCGRLTELHIISNVKAWIKLRWFQATCAGRRIRSCHEWTFKKNEHPPPLLSSPFVMMEVKPAHKPTFKQETNKVSCPLSQLAV